MAIVVKHYQQEIYEGGKDPHEWTNQIHIPACAVAVKKLCASVPAVSETMPPVPANVGNKNTDKVMTRVTTPPSTLQDQVHRARLPK